MTQEKIFGEALWVGARETGVEKIFVLRGKFSLKRVKKATLRVLGLGLFYCYINGERVSDDLFMPLNSEYEPRNNFPIDEKLSGFRIYLPEYDVAHLLKEGENTIAIHFGGGWYTYDRECKFGDAKAIYRIFGTDEDGAFDIVSSQNDRIGKGFVSEYTVPSEVDVPTERHDYNLSGADACTCDFDDSDWDRADLAVPPVTEYEFSRCPADRVCERITPALIRDDGEKKTYDSKKNISGYPVLKITAKKGEKVTVRLSEEILENCKIDPQYCHKQEFSCVSDGNGRISYPLFTWFGFRYFEVTGEAEVVYVASVHSDVKVTSSFSSDNETLNWLYEAFLNTQLSNMHMGIPSDCPHIERRGYTGDGQLACHGAMNMLDAEEFYRKWIRDIADSQDSITGHVQNTVPYTHGGGGPGGFGCAMVEVPYQFYRHYGDLSVLERYYPNMLRYFDYLEAHSEDDLVVSDKKGEWCLGEWCTPEGMILPPPFVNNYYYVRSLCRAISIAKLIGKEEDIPLLESRVEKRKKALVRSYYNPHSKDHNFFGGHQGANAFMIDIGIEGKYTYRNTVDFYESLGRYDTGIFGTEVLTRVLFEKGDAELAVKLLTSESVHSYAELKKRGATTIWEYLPASLKDRSHNHPMFGSVTAFLFDYLLGIREAEGSLTYDSIKIEPMIVSSVNRLSGHRTLKKGIVSVAYTKKENEIEFEITVPDGLCASFVFEGQSHQLVAGENKFLFKL